MRLQHLPLNITPIGKSAIEVDVLSRTSAEGTMCYHKYSKTPTTPCHEIMACTNQGWPAHYSDCNAHVHMHTHTCPKNVTKDPGRAICMPTTVKESFKHLADIIVLVCEDYSTVRMKSTDRCPHCTQAPTATPSTTTASLLYPSPPDTVKSER